MVVDSKVVCGVIAQSLACWDELLIHVVVGSSGDEDASEKGFPGRKDEAIAMVVVVADTNDGGTAWINPYLGQK